MTIYDKIYEKAKPYLNTRRNEIHVSISYDFAQRLLSFYPQADDDIVLPAILLHDVGWKMVPEEKQLDAFGLNVRDEEVRRFHETQGAGIAGEILSLLSLHHEQTGLLLLYGINRTCIAMREKETPVNLQSGLFKSFLIPRRCIGYSLVFVVGEPKIYQFLL
jgi:hypothetical protein